MVLCCLLAHYNYCPLSVAIGRVGKRNNNGNKNKNNNSRTKKSAHYNTTIPETGNIRSHAAATTHDQSTQRLKMNWATVGVCPSLTSSFPKRRANKQLSAYVFCGSAHLLARSRSLSLCVCFSNSHYLCCSHAQYFSQHHCTMLKQRFNRSSIELTVEMKKILLIPNIDFILEDGKQNRTNKLFTVTHFTPQKKISTSSVSSVSWDKQTSSSKVRASMYCSL